MAQESEQNMATHPKGSPHRTVADALTALCTAAQRYGHAGLEFELLREPVREMCVAAHEEQMPPERMLVQLKQVLNDRSGLNTLAPEAAEDRRRQIVTLAIAEYFANQHSR
jgi:predicted secreted protein